MANVQVPERGRTPDCHPGVPGLPARNPATWPGRTWLQPHSIRLEGTAGPRRAGNKREVHIADERLELVFLSSGD